MICFHTNMFIANQHSFCSPLEYIPTHTSLYVLFFGTSPRQKVVRGSNLLNLKPFTRFEILLRICSEAAG